MTMPSTFLIFQFSVVALLLTALTSTSNIPQPTSLVADMSQSYTDERNPAVGFSDHQNSPASAKPMSFTDDDNLSDEEVEYNNGDSKNIWSQLLKKRFINIAIRGGSTNTGDGRLWAIPYRFGKRAAMPYRFGKRSTSS